MNVILSVAYIQVRVLTFTLRIIRRKENNMEQLIKLLQGLLDGEFELKEYTRSNKENDDNTITSSFGFDVITKK